MSTCDQSEIISNNEIGHICKGYNFIVMITKNVSVRKTWSEASR